MQLLCEKRLKLEHSNNGEVDHIFFQKYFSTKKQEQFVCYETYGAYLGEQS